MKIKHYQDRGIINAELSWEDFNRLIAGDLIGDRYNPKSKLEIRMEPVDEEVLWTTTLSERETGILDRRSDDILIEIPEGPLRCSLIRAFNLYRDFGNLQTINGPPHPLIKHIRVQYPV